MNETEGQGIERQLTSAELEAIAGGGFNLDRMAKLGGVMHGRPEPNSIDLLGEVGGRIAQGGYIVGQAFKGLFSDLAGDYTKAGDIQKNTISRSEEVYQDFKDSPGGKIIGGIALVIGGGVAGGAVSAGGRALISATSGIRNITPILESGALGATRSVPAGAISFLEVKEEATLGQFVSADQLKAAGIPSNARIVGYASAKDTDDFVKEFKAVSGLNNDVKLGCLQVEWSSNGSTVHDYVPLIDLGNIEQSAVTEPSATVNQDNVRKGGFARYGQAQYMGGRG